jgi:hypothetical protein
LQHPESRQEDFGFSLAIGPNQRRVVTPYDPAEVVEGDPVIAPGPRDHRVAQGLVGHLVAVHRRGLLAVWRTRAGGVVAVEQAICVVVRAVGAVAGELAFYGSDCGGRRGFTGTEESQRRDRGPKTCV